MIHILQLLCPQRHCFTAVAWDDQSVIEAVAAYRLGLSTAQIAGVGKAPVCAICAAVDFKLEDGVTQWATMQEALPHLEACELAQLVTRERLTRTADQN